MIGTQYAQTAQMMSRNPAAANNPQMKLMKFLPIIFGVICIKFPAGVVLYYGMSNACRIAQQSAMYRYDPKVRALVVQEVIEVEAHTTEIDEATTGKRKAVGPGKAKPGASLAKKPPTSKAPQSKGPQAKNGPSKNPPARTPPSKVPQPPPAPRSRFQKLLAAANEQQKQRNETKRSPKASGLPGPSNTSGKTRDNRGPGGPARQVEAAGKASNGANRPKSSPGVRANGGTPSPKTTNGNGSAKPRLNGGDTTGVTSRDSAKEKGTADSTIPPRTGAGGRTGARSGNNKKRRGR